MQLRQASLWAGLLALGAGGCATTSGAGGAVGTETAAQPIKADAPFASTYVAPTSPAVLIRDATVLDGEGREYASADVLIKNGKIAALGSSVAAPSGAIEIDGRGKFVTPGIIDAHSHLGAYPSPSISATSDGNELTQPNTAEVWVEHSVWPMDPGFSRAIAGGITALHVLPGSGNLFGGRGVTLRPVLGALSVQQMKFPDAPQSLKMACGENPSRVYGGRNTSPATGMGNIAGYRAAWAKASEYSRKWDAYEAKLQKYEKGEKKGEKPTPPDRDLELETLRGVLDGEILVQWHCFRADEMALALDVAREFGFKIAAFHHAVESYKIADKLAAADVCSAMWADWWGFKLEAYDSIRENIPFVHAGGACAIVHSDDPLGIQRLNQEASKAWSDGKRAGLNITRGEVWTWLSLNPAKALGIAERTGSLAVGKAGDVVIWSADPLSTYALAEKVFIDGALAFDRASPVPPRSDFELGQDHTADQQ